MENNILQDFDTFSRALIVSKDVDPTYPVITWMCDEYGFEPMWFCFAFVNFYRLESALKMCMIMPDSSKWNAKVFKNLRVTKEISKFDPVRRGSSRNPDNQILLMEKAIEFIDDFPDISNFRERIHSEIPFFNRWASYKMQEIFHRAFGLEEFAITHLDLSKDVLEVERGPIAGLKHLYGRDSEYDESWFDHWNRFGENLAKAYKTGVGEIETCLCKFNQLVKGQYYIGQDVDKMYGLKPIMGDNKYHRMMSETFESSLWRSSEGIDKKKNNIYTTHGKVYNSHLGGRLKTIDVLDVILNTD